MLLYRYKYQKQGSEILKPPLARIRRWYVFYRHCDVTRNPVVKDNHARLVDSDQRTWTEKHQAKSYAHYNYFANLTETMLSNAQLV